MKFAYIDESGASDQGDIFVMAGIMIDAIKIRKWTTAFDEKLKGALYLHPKPPNEFKTKKFIDGKDKWSEVPPADRKQFLLEICKQVVICGTIYAYAISFENFNKSVEKSDGLPTNQDDYWVASSLFITCLIQKHQQKKRNNKGLTVLIFDDNKKGMSKLSESIYKSDGWYDDIYAPNSEISNTPLIKPKNRFDQIINTPFAIKSQHSSLIQVADILSYIYRRYLELKSNKQEQFKGEQKYYVDLVKILEKKRKKLGLCPYLDAESVRFYKEATHQDWKI